MSYSINTTLLTLSGIVCYQEFKLSRFRAASPDPMEMGLRTAFAPFGGSFGFLITISGKSIEAQERILVTKMCSASFEVGFQRAGLGCCGFDSFSLLLCSRLRVNERRAELHMAKPL